MKTPLYLEQTENTDKFLETTSSPNHIKKPNLWTIFYYNATKQQKKIIILLNLIFTMCCSIIIGTSILYKAPIILCKSSVSSQYEVCSEEKACSSSYYMIDIVNSSRSFVADFSLICEKSAMKRLALTCCFCGMLIGCILSTFVIISKKNRVYFLSGFGFIFSSSLLIMLVCKNFYIIAFLTGSAAFCYLLLNNNVYLYARENFNGDLAGFATIFYNVCWGLSAMIFAILNYFSDADWRLFLSVSGVISLISSGLLLLNSIKTINEDSSLKKPNDEKEEENSEQSGFFISLSELWPNKQLRINYFFYALSFSYYSVSYYCIYIEMDSIGGDLYLKIFLCCGLELLSALFTGVLIEFYDAEKLLKFNITILSIFFTIFLLSPKDLSNAEPWQILFFTCCLLIVKVNNDMLNISLYLNVPKALTDKYFSFWMLSSRFLSRFLNMILPSFNYAVKLMGIHPFGVYGLIWLGFRFMFNWTKLLEDEGVEELMRETKLSFHQKLSIICQSRSYANLNHDDMLRNIQYEGKQLSVFRKMKKNEKCLYLMGNGVRRRKSSL